MERDRPACDISAAAPAVSAVSLAAWDCPEPQDVPDRSPFSGPRPVAAQWIWDSARCPGIFVFPDQCAKVVRQGEPVGSEDSEATPVPSALTPARP